MANDYYTHGGYPATGSQGASSSMRSELDTITMGFDKLAPLTGNAGKFLIVNASQTAQSVSAALTETAGNVTITGTTTLTTLLLAAGLVGAPSLAFTGDTDNGWWRPAADTQAWSIAGAEAMRLSAAGLGVGVTALSPLHVKSGNSTTVRVETTSARGTGQVAMAIYDPTGQKGYFGYGSANDNLQIFNGLNASLEIYTNAALRAQVSAAGEFGIGGTPAAGLRLHVHSAGAIARFQTTTARGSGNGYLEFNDPTGNKGYIGYGAANDGFNVFNALNDFMSFGTNGLERMRITAGGLVGIGVTPVTPMHVRRVGSGSGFLGEPVLRLECSDPAADVGIQFFNNGVDSQAGISEISGALRFGTGAAERARFTAAGLFLVNRTSDSGFGSFQVTRSGTGEIADFSVTGGTGRVNIRAEAGSLAALRIAGNGTTPGTTSLDIQQDSASAVDIVNRANARLSLYTNNAERLQITAAGVITEVASGQELGFKDLPRTTGGFARGQCFAVSAGQTVNTAAQGNIFSVYNDSAANITLTQGGGLTMRLHGTATTGSRTLLARGFATIWFNSATECVVLGDVS